MYDHVAGACAILRSRSGVAVENVDLKDSVGALREVPRCGSVDNGNGTTQPGEAAAPKEAYTRHRRASASVCSIQ